MSALHPVPSHRRIPPQRCTYTRPRLRVVRTCPSGDTHRSAKSHCGKTVEEPKGGKSNTLSDIQSAGLTSTLHIYVDTAGIFTHINRSQKYLKDSLLPVILYEVSRLLAAYPLLNGYYTEQGIALYKDINVGFDIDIDKGLKVLKIPGSAEKSVSELEAAIIELSGRYLDDALQIDDLEGVTFTITDLLCRRRRPFSAVDQ